MVPQNRLLRPDVPALQALVDNLQAERFLPPGSQPTIPRSFALGTVSAIWQVDGETPARYPFAAKSPYPEEEDYWNLELHLAGALLCYSGEIVGPTNLSCVGCGTSLERKDEHPTLAGWLTEVALACPRCKRAVVPAEHHCEVAMDPDEAPRQLVGGGLFRCGFFIDCQKSVPDLPAELDPTLRAILHATLGPGVEFPDVH